MYEHSIKVYPLYKHAAQIVKQVREGSTVNVKELINRKARRQRTKPLQTLVVETLQRHSQIDFLLKRSKLLDNETRLDPWLTRVLITELLWGAKSLRGDSKPVKAILAYQQIFKAHVSDLREHFKEAPVKVSKPRFVRVNTLLMTVNEAVEGFVQEGWSLVRHTNPNYEEFISKVSNLGPDEFMVDMNIKELLIFPPGVQFCEHRAYLNGSLILQDKASCFPVQLLNPQPGSVVLDMCAAPGVKTSHIAALMNNDGCIYAIDRNPERFSELNKFLEKSGVECAKTINKDALKITQDDCPNVDCILVDPSCSGSGMVSRLELGLYESNKTDRLANLAGFQIKLLKHALRKFPTAKRVVYSTCSINPEENEHVVREVLYSNANYRLMSATDLLNVPWPRFSSLQYGDVGKNCLTLRLENDCTNGFFVAVFERLQDGMQNPLFTPYFRDNFNRKNLRYENEAENKTGFKKNGEKLKEQQMYEIRENGVGNYGDEAESTMCEVTKSQETVYENEAETKPCEAKKDCSKKKERKSAKLKKKFNVSLDVENYENGDIKMPEVCSKKKQKKREKSKEKQTTEASHESQENNTENNECDDEINTHNVNEVSMKKKKKKRDKSKDKKSQESRENGVELVEAETKEKVKEVLHIDMSTKKHKKNKKHDDSSQNVVDKIHKKKKRCKSTDTPNDLDNSESVECIKTKKKKCKSKEIDLEENPNYPSPESHKFIAGNDISPLSRKLKKKKTKRIELDEDVQIAMSGDNKKKKKSKYEDVQIENDLTSDISVKKKKKLIDEDVRVTNDAIGDKKKRKSKCEEVCIEKDAIANDLGCKHERVNFFDGETHAEDFTPQINGKKLLNIKDFIGQSKDNFIKDILTKRF